MPIDGKLLEFVHETFTQEEIDLLANNSVLLYGPTGLRRYLASLDIRYFAYLYFPEQLYADLAPIHYEIIRDINEIASRLRNNKPGLKKAYAIPRAHAKSTWFSRWLPLYALLYGLSPLTVLLGATQTSADRLMRNIQNEYNEALQEDFGDVQWGIERIEYKGNVITSFGIGSGAIRGISSPARPFLIIGDDLDTDEGVRSQIETQSNREWLDKAVLNLGDSIYGRTHYIFVGTLIRRTSLLQYIMDKPEFSSRTASAVIRFSQSPLWEQWRNQYLELARNGQQPRDASEDSFYQEHKTDLLKGTELLWDRPDAYRYAMLRKLDDERAFYSEFQNTPKEAGMSLGDVQRVDLPANPNEYHLLASLDSTIKGSKHNDLAAWVEVLFHPQHKKMIVSYVDARQRNYAQTVDDVTHRVQSNPQRYRLILVETNSAGELIADMLQNRLGSVQRVYNKIPKHERISALSYYMENGQIQFYHGLDNAIFQEIEAFPFAPHDDILDSLSNILYFLRDNNLIQIIQPEMHNPYAGRIDINLGYTNSGYTNHGYIGQR